MSNNGICHVIMYHHRDLFSVGSSDTSSGSSEALAAATMPITHWFTCRLKIQMNQRNLMYTLIYEISLVQGYTQLNVYELAFFKALD